MRSMRTHPSLQRVFALLIAMCLFCAGANAAALAQRGDQDSARVVACDSEGCAQSSSPAADELARSDVDKLSGTPKVPVRSSCRHWIFGADACESGTASVAWLRSPAHDPPKTIRFCTLLI